MMGPSAEKTARFEDIAERAFPGAGRTDENDCIDGTGKIRRHRLSSFLFLRLLRLFFDARESFSSGISSIENQPISSHLCGSRMNGVPPSILHRNVGETQCCRSSGMR